MYISQNPENWMFDYKNNSIYFKPLKINLYTKKLFFSHADFCLFMSATILDYKRFAKDVGIDEKEIYAIRRESSFDVSRNPIKIYDEFNLSYNYLKLMAPLTIPYIKNILEKHKNEKGVIHTVSYQCNNFLMKKLNNDRLIDHNTWNREKILKKFEKSNKPLVLISPSMVEGVDLPDDKCRFQIIFKIPFPSLGDKQTRLYMELDDSWYKYKTAINLIQTYGRGMRSENDYCNTYFMDGRLENFINQDYSYYGFLPDFFKNAINCEISDVSKTIDEEYIELSKNRKIHEITDEIKNPAHSSEVIFEFSEVTDKVMDKYYLKSDGNNLIKQKNFDEAVDFYKKLIYNEYFINDYYPYSKLCEVYKKMKDSNNEFLTIIDFFDSGRYCSNSQLLWFKLRLKYLTKYVSFNFDLYDELLEKFRKNGALNKELQNTPVVIAACIKSGRKVSVMSQEEYDYKLQNDELNLNYKFAYKTGDYKNALYYFEKLWDTKDFNKNLTAHKRLCGFYAKVGDWENVIRIANEYFKSNAKRTNTSEEWFEKKVQHANLVLNSQKKLVKTNVFNYSQFYKGKTVEVLDDDLKAKFKLILKAKKLKSNEQFTDYVDFLNSLILNKYFENDYYPYRQLVIYYKNNQNAQKDITHKFFKSGIHCNNYNYFWFINKLKHIGALDYKI